MTQENAITKASKDQDIKYKSAEAASTDKEIAELASDRETTNSEHAAVLEYLEKLNSRCVAKPETYENRKQRREAEIAGLEEAIGVTIEKLITPLLHLTPQIVFATRQTLSPPPEAPEALGDPRGGKGHKGNLQKLVNRYFQRCDKLKTRVNFRGGRNININDLFFRIRFLYIYIYIYIYACCLNVNKCFQTFVSIFV